MALRKLRLQLILTPRPTKISGDLLAVARTRRERGESVTRIARFTENVWKRHQ